MGLGQVREWERNRFALSQTTSILLSLGYLLHLCFASFLGCLVYVVCGSTSCSYAWLLRFVSGLFAICGVWLDLLARMCDGACRRDSKR